MRLSGSHCKHRSTKSKKRGSVQRKTCASVFVPGRRFLPLELGIMRGLPLESLKNTKG